MGTRGATCGSVDGMGRHRHAACRLADRAGRPAKLGACRPRRRVVFVGRPPSHAAREPPPGGKNALDPAHPGRRCAPTREPARGTAGRCAPAFPKVFLPPAGGPAGLRPPPDADPFLAPAGLRRARLWAAPPGLPLALQGPHPGRVRPGFAGPPLCRCAARFSALARGARGLRAGRPSPAARPPGR